MLATPATDTRAEIVSFYKKATYCYAAPFALLLLAFVWEFAVWLFLFIILPSSIAGLFFTTRGLALARKSRDTEKKDVGYANVVLGGIALLVGLLVWALAYATRPNAALS
jgi:hypothetical protein